MSDGSAPAPFSNTSGADKSQAGVWARLILFLCLIGAILYAANTAMHTLQARNAQRQTEEMTVQSTGLVALAPKGLVSQFTDKSGRLLADPPDSAAKLIDPDTIVLAHIVSSDPESPVTDWPRFETHLSQVTGKKVVDQEFDNTAGQISQINQGKITLVALHAADTPFLVNNCGFQPIAVLGQDTGINGNHMDVIVPADSSISKPADLKGHSLVCTEPRSITGYRAAVALLMQNEGLRPNVDYFVTWSLGQRKSITGLVKSGYEAAAVSDDKLQSLLSDGQVDKTKFRVIYESEVIPRTTIGYFYNLKPELADKVRDAILTFKPAASTAKAATQPDSVASDAGEAADTDSAALHFIPIDYKKDFKLVRAIDDSFDPRLDSMAKTHQSATAAQ